jgi:hypothetical protein
LRMINRTAWLWTMSVDVLDVRFVDTYKVWFQSKNVAVVNHIIEWVSVERFRPGLVGLGHILMRPPYISSAARSPVSWLG